MAQRNHTIDVAGLEVSVTRKRIKNLYVKVSRADGSVRVSAPWRASDAVVRDAVTEKLAWIQRKRTAIAERPMQPEPTYEDGEPVRAWGRSRTLCIATSHGRPVAEASGGNALALRLPEGATLQQRVDAVDTWYRAELDARIPDLIARWEPVVGHRVAEWRVRNMRTRWGSCNPSARRIWLSLELAKHPPECLEYVVVHEMAHLIEANHSGRFYALMDRLLPDWRERKRLLETA